MSETWIILGATSSMARAMTRRLAEDGHRLLLTGRDMEDLAATAADARARGSKAVETFSVDMRDTESFGPLIEAAKRYDGSLNTAVFVGSMPAQADIDADPSLIDGVIRDSFIGPAEILQRLAPEMEARKSGTVVGVGSVAGDRGRVGNYVYGAA